jgi:5-methylthioadenosine/S-adenosylhomocysteine deaminase
MKLIKNARVLTLDKHDTEHECADILIEGSKIVEVGPDLDVSRAENHISTIDAHGLLAMPGLVNGHFHSPGNFLRGAVDDYPLEIFMLYEIPPFSNKLPSQRLNYVRTLLSAIEMLKLGITSVHDDAFYNPYPTQTEINSLMQAYVDIGMRAVVTIDTANVIE